MWIPAHPQKPRRTSPSLQPVRSSGAGGGDGFGGDAELRALFERTYGPVKNRGFEAFQQSRKKAATLEQLYVTRIREDDYLLVDGYNIIFSWDELRDTAPVMSTQPVKRLVNVLSNCSGRAQVSSYSRVRCYARSKAVRLDRAARRHSYCLHQGGRNCGYVH